MAGKTAVSIGVHSNVEKKRSNSIKRRLAALGLDLKGEQAMSVPPYTTMTEAIQGLRERGFTANFEFLDQAFRAVGTGKTFQAKDLTIVEHHRFEGTSDPDDMSILYAIESSDGMRGLVADAFGTYANPKLGSFLKNVKVHESV